MRPTNLSMSLLVWTILVLVAAPATPQGSVFIVADQVGPDVDFTDLTLAGADSPDGATLLVRSGTYSSVLAGKSLQVVAERGATVTTGLLRIQDLQSDQIVVVRGLSANTIDVRDNLGTVWIEDCTTSRIRATNSQHVVVIRCSVGPPQNPFFAGPAISTEFSDLTVLDSVVQGADGRFGSISLKHQVYLPGEPGQPAIAVLTANRVFLAGNTFNGGRGGRGGVLYLSGVCTDSGDGAPGLLVADAGAIVRTLDNTFAGGRGGQAFFDCTPGAAAPRMAIEPGAVVRRLPAGATARTTASSPVREGDSLRLTVQGEPFDTAFVFFALAPQPSQLYVDHLSAVFLLAFPFDLLATATLDGNGELSDSFVVPELGPGVESVQVFFLTGHASTTGAELLGTATASLLLDEAF